MRKSKLSRADFGPAFWPIIDEINSLHDRVVALENTALSGIRPGAAYIADEDGILQGPLTNQQLGELADGE